MSLNRQIVCPCSAAGSAGLTEPSLVLQQSVGAGVLVLQADQVPALWAVAVGARRQVGLVLGRIFSGRLPGGRVAAHLQEGGLLHRSSHFVLLCHHVLRVLLAGQLVVRERERQEVRGASHTVVEVWRWGRCSRSRQRELLERGGTGRTSRPRTEETSANRDGSHQFPLKQLQSRTFQQDRELNPQLKVEPAGSPGLSI